MPATTTSDESLRVQLRVEIPSDVAYIERVVDLVRHPCVELSYNSHQLALNVPVALTEALSNAILRANHEDPGKRVRVSAEIDATRLVIEIADEGVRFDLQARTNDLSNLEYLEREDGRGLYLMQKLMDHVERFDASPDGESGNVVRLTLRRA
jgi:serine/threonine-protein kinase RsbW